MGNQKSAVDYERETPEILERLADKGRELVALQDADAWREFVERKLGAESGASLTAAQEDWAEQTRRRTLDTLDQVGLKFLPLDRTGKPLSTPFRDEKGRFVSRDNAIGRLYGALNPFGRRG